VVILTEAWLDWSHVLMLLRLSIFLFNWSVPGLALIDFFDLNFA
jgi:hypothetical protein